MFGSPQFNSRRIAALSNLVQDFLILQYINYFKEIISTVIDNVKHRPLFCSMLQFKTWCELLGCVVEDTVIEEDVELSEDVQKEREELFLKWRTKRCTLYERRDLQQ